MSRAPAAASVFWCGGGGDDDEGHVATSLVRVVSIVSGGMGDDVATLLARRVVVSRLSENISKKKKYLWAQLQETRQRLLSLLTLSLLAVAGDVALLK